MAIKKPEILRVIDYAPAVTWREISGCFCWNRVIFYRLEVVKLLFQQYYKVKKGVKHFRWLQQGYFLICHIMEKKVFFNTTVPENLIKEFKILAIRLSKRQNELLVEAIQDLLKKYDKKTKK